ncbi:hypothetical protein ABPG74_005840 [Tetrahymena malaccensis]
MFQKEREEEEEIKVNKDLEENNISENNQTSQQNQRSRRSSIEDNSYDEQCQYSYEEKYSSSLNSNNNMIPQHYQESEEQDHQEISKPLKSKENIDSAQIELNVQQANDTVEKQFISNPITEISNDLSRNVIQTQTENLSDNEKEITEQLADNPLDQEPKKKLKCSSTQSQPNQNPKPFQRTPQTIQFQLDKIDSSNFTLKNQNVENSSQNIEYTGTKNDENWQKKCQELKNGLQKEKPSFNFNNSNNNSNSYNNNFNKNKIDNHTPLPSKKNVQIQKKSHNLNKKLIKLEQKNDKFQQYLNTTLDFQINALKIFEENQQSIYNSMKSFFKKSNDLINVENNQKLDTFFNKQDGQLLNLYHHQSQRFQMYQARYQHQPYQPQIQETNYVPLPQQNEQRTNQRIPLSSANIPNQIPPQQVQTNNLISQFQVQKQGNVPQQYSRSSYSNQFLKK